MTAKNEKDEDAAEIRRLLIDYHAAMVEADIEKLSGLLAGRGIFNATINSMRNPWRLQFKMTCAKRENGWRVTSARYTSY